MDILSFFKKVTGLVPTVDQEQFLLGLTNFDLKNLAASAGRQTGKSLCSAVAVLWWCFEYSDPVDVLLMSTMDSYVYDHVEQLFAKNPDLAAEIVQEGIAGLVPLRGFAIRKGSRVHVRKGTERQIRGLGVDICIADEAAELPAKMITTALGNIRGKVSKFIMLSTPHKTGLFTEIVSNPDKYGFKVYNWSELNCSWHGKANLDLKRKTMSTQEWQMEVLGQVLSMAERAYFPSKHIDACIIECPCTREGGALSSIEIGLDFGFDPCKTVLVVTEKIFAKRKLLFIKAWHKKPIEEIAPEIGQLIEEWNPSLVKADDKPAEYQHKIEPYTKHKIHYLSAPMHKEAIISQMQRRVRMHQLIIPDHFTNIILELRKYHRGKRCGDDIVDALALACYEPAVPLSTKPTGVAIFN